MGKSVILETERLVLREFDLEDTDSLFQVLGDPLAMLFLRKDSGELIGDCGCFIRELYGDVECELAWHVRRDFWGKGYASEAAQHCIEYAFSKLGIVRVIALVRPENRSSCRVAEKSGMTCERVIFWRGYDHSVYVKQR